jgi:hypothetical protein
MPVQLDEEELADWRAGRSAVYQLAALTVGSRLAVAGAGRQRKTPARGSWGFKAGRSAWGTSIAPAIKQHRSNIVEVDGCGQYGWIWRGNSLDRTPIFEV